MLGLLLDFGVIKQYEDVVCKQNPFMADYFGEVDLMYIKKSTHPNTLPRGIELLTVRQFDLSVCSSPESC